MEEKKKNLFNCACCDGVFEKAWSDEEALAELKENFGDVSPEDCHVVCDDCFRQIKGDGWE